MNSIITDFLVHIDPALLFGFQNLVDVSDVTLTNIIGKIYTGEAYFGSPAQRFDMIYDTGSPVAWVYDSVGCKSTG